MATFFLSLLLVIIWFLIAIDQSLKVWIGVQLLSEFSTSSLYSTIILVYSALLILRPVFITVVCLIQTVYKRAFA